MHVTYRNAWTGATFTVSSKEAAKRMESLPSWKRV